MNATTRLNMSDLSRQKTFDTDLSDQLQPGHTVDQAIDFYLESVGVSPNGLRWTAYSRGVRLDGKMRLEELPSADVRWTVMPEVSAGAV